MPTKIEKAAAAKQNEAGLRRAATGSVGPKTSSQDTARKFERDDKTPPVPEEVGESIDVSSSGSATKEIRAPTIRDVKAWTDLKGRDGVN